MFFSEPSAGGPGQGTPRLAMIDITTGNQIGTSTDIPRGSLTYLTPDGSRVMVVGFNWNPDSTEVRVIDTLAGSQVGTTVSHVGTSTGTADAVLVNTTSGRAFITTVSWEDSPTPVATTRLTVIDTDNGTEVSTFTHLGQGHQTLVLCRRHSRRSPDARRHRSGDWICGRDQHVDRHASR